MNGDLITKETSIIGQTKPVQLIIVEGLIENLPEVLTTIKDIFKMSKQEQIVDNYLTNRLEEMKINKDNFHILVTSLTELSRSNNVDEETKAIFKDMIKILFNSFVDKMKTSNDISVYLNRL